jgi:hypothetical protein
MDFSVLWILRFINCPQGIPDEKPIVLQYGWRDFGVFDIHYAS